MSPLSTAVAFIFCAGLVLGAVPPAATKPGGAAQLVAADGARDARAAKYEIALSKFPAYGQPSGDSPNYHERALATWYNAVRTGRRTYVAKWLAPFMYASSDTTHKNVFAGSTFPAKAPVPLNPNLVRLARAHSADRLTCKSSSVSAHNDCNGTAFGTRLKRYYTPSGTAGEIYFGMGQTGTRNHMLDPFTAIGGYICDGPTYPTLGRFANCPKDSKAGHRKNIMTLGGETGCGFAVDSTDSVVTTCNMCSKTKFKPVPAIVSGAHLLDPRDTSKFFFMVNYRGACKTAAYVVVDGTRTALTRESCVKTNGVTYVSSALPLPTGGCQRYHFEIGSARYPAGSGEFATYGFGTCLTNY